MFNLLLVLIYICFISLGLPDSLLGSAWPVLHQDMNVPMSYAGVISSVIFIGTILSSLLSDVLSKKLGSGLLTAISVTMTALGLFGFSISDHFWMLIAWSVPYGFGAGGVDAVLNNYVALHYKAQHMSWLHCFWGIGASISPYIMSFSLVKLDDWSKGYSIVSVIQMILSALIFMSLPLWKQKNSESEAKRESQVKALTLRGIFAIQGAAPCFLTFFTYCSLELTTSLWACSYLVENRGMDVETASAFSSMFYIGITLGRAVNGFLAMRFSDRFLIRMGLGIISVGITLLFIPSHIFFALAGFVIIGLGCAPIYPCIIHMTPDVFGRDKSQAMIGFQMAFAYVGFCVMPPLFGWIAEYISIALLPAYLLVLLLIMTMMHELMVRKTKCKKCLSIVLCFLLSFTLSACANEPARQDEGVHPDFLTEKNWEYKTLSCTEVLRFDKDGGFSYYESCGNPVGNSDCYETYSYDKDTGIVTAYGHDDSVEDMKIHVLRYTEDSLLVSIEGVIKEFYTYYDVPNVNKELHEQVAGYSAYVAIRNIHDNMIETAPSNFDMDAGGSKLIREEKLSETAVFYQLYEEIIHVDGAQADKITTEFKELKREDVSYSVDNSFSAGYIWYNDDLEIIKIVYYGSLEIWE